jgi:hypothetical protein
MKIISFKGIKNSIAILIAAPFILFFCYWGMLKWHDIQLEKRTSESKIIGRTPAQIIALLGPPKDTFRQDWEPVGTEIMIYTNHGSRICRINVENGVAKSIERLSDH